MLRPMLDRVADGECSICREDQHLLVYRLYGEISAQTLRKLTDTHTAWVSDLSYFCVLVDAQKVTAITHEARRIAVEWNTMKIPRAVAIVTGSFAIRVAADLLFRAIRLMRQRPLNSRLFGDEESARAWLAEMQVELARTPAA